jgi:hypothetical protein
MSDHQFDALDRDMLVEIAIGQRAEIERLMEKVEEQGKEIEQLFAESHRRLEIIIELKAKMRAIAKAEGGE